MFHDNSLRHRAGFSKTSGSSICSVGSNGSIRLFDQIFKLHMETLLIKVLDWYVVILLSLEIQLQGLKNNTMHSYMSVMSSLKNDNR